VVRHTIDIPDELIQAQHDVTLCIDGMMSLNRPMASRSVLEYESIKSNQMSQIIWTNMNQRRVIDFFRNLYYG